MGSAADRLFDRLKLDPSAEAAGIAYAGACIGIGLVNIAAALSQVGGAIARVADATVVAAQAGRSSVVPVPPGVKLR